MNYKELSNGSKIPELGYGVYRIPEDGVTKDCVLKALKAGYRHIDTAQAYYNEVICCELQMSDILANVVNLANFYIC